MKRITLALLCALFVSNFSYAQKSAWPLKISLLDESISLPNTWFLDYPYNPAIMVGTEFNIKSNPRNAIFLSGDLGFYHHKHWQNALFLNVGIGYRQDFWKMYASLRLGPGYSHAFAAAPVYKFEDGEYKEVTDWGSPKFSPFANLEIGYKFTSEPDSPSIYFTFGQSVDLGLIPFPHQFVGLGFQFYPF